MDPDPMTSCYRIPIIPAILAVLAWSAAAGAATWFADPEGPLFSDLYTQVASGDTIIALTGWYGQVYAPPGVAIVGEAGATARSVLVPDAGSVSGFLVQGPGGLFRTGESLLGTGAGGVFIDVASGVSIELHPQSLNQVLGGLVLFPSNQDHQNRIGITAGRISRTTVWSPPPAPFVYVLDMARVDIWGPQNPVLFITGGIFKLVSSWFHVGDLEGGDGSLVAYDAVFTHLGDDQGGDTDAGEGLYRPGYGIMLEGFGATAGTFRNCTFRGLRFGDEDLPVIDARAACTVQADSVTVTDCDWAFRAEGPGTGLTVTVASVTDVTRVLDVTDGAACSVSGLAADGSVHGATLAGTDAAVITSSSFLDSGAALEVLDASAAGVSGCTFGARGTGFPSSFAFTVKLPPGQVLPFFSDQGNAVQPGATLQGHAVALSAGVLDRSIRLPDPGAPYLMPYGGLTVAGPLAPVLTLDPGARLLFGHWGTITVGDASGPGGLMAEGVLFSSTSEGDFIGAQPQPGQWTGLVFHDARPDSTLLRGCTVRYAGGDAPWGFDPAPAAVQIRDGDPVLEEVLVTASATAGVLCDGPDATPSLRFSALAGNGVGLACRGGARPHLVRLCFDGNVSGAVIDDGTPMPLGSLDARGCWWGSADGPTPGLDVTGPVRFEPWANAPVCAATATGLPASESAAFRMDPPSPNPFNPRTTLGFTLPVEAPVHLRVHDLHGRAVRTLLDGAPLESGRHAALWNGRDDAGRPLPSGSYFYRLSAGQHRATGRLLLLK